MIDLVFRVDVRHVRRSQTVVLVERHCPYTNLGLEILILDATNV